MAVALENPNEGWVEHAARMLEQLSRSTVAISDFPGYPPRGLKLKEYASLLLKSKDNDEMQLPQSWFRLHFKKHLEEAVQLMQDHPVIREALNNTKYKYLGAAVLNTGFGGYDPLYTIRRIIEGAMRRMLMSDALTAARDLDRLLVLGQSRELPGYEVTLVYGLQLADRTEIEEGLFAVPYNGTGDEWQTRRFSTPGTFEPESTGMVIREFQWGQFLQVDDDRPLPTVFFRSDADLVKLMEVFSLATERPLGILYRYRCVPQWIREFGYPFPSDYRIYNLSSPWNFRDESLAEKDIDELRSLWRRYKEYRGERLPIERVVEHLARALARHGRFASQDGILDTAIALETVYTADARTEIAYRLATRAASFLGVDPDDRTSIAKSVRSFYNIRSRIAHGDVGQRDDLPAAWRDGFDIAKRTLLKLLHDGDLPGDWDEVVQG